MKLRTLEMALQKVRGFSSPDPGYEQYQTPAVLAARLLFDASLHGDIGGCSVLDLGCGTGILAIGACLMGAGTVTGIDQDPRALETAAENARALGVEVGFIRAIVGEGPFPTEISPVDTVIMNPPFGAQKEHADRPFIDRALQMGTRVYGIFNAGSLSFVTSYVRNRASVVSVTSGALTIPRSFYFHTRDSLDIPVEIILLERTGAARSPEK